MKNSKGPLLYGKDQQRAILEQLRRPHEKGNPFALFKTLHLAQKWQLTLPMWATEASQDIIVAFMSGEATGKRNTPLRLYRERLKPWIRARTYQSIMSWKMEPLFYKSMPTSVIEKWYRKEIFPNDVTSAKAAELSLEALSDTFAECEADTIEKQKYYDPLADLAREIEDLRDPEDENKKHSKENLDQVRDHFSGSTGLYDWSIEATDKLIGILVFFGPPPGDPPQHVVELLAERRNRVDSFPSE